MSVSELKTQQDEQFLAERIDLACAFRWACRMDLHESVANHFSLCVAGQGTKFLINPNGRHFSRMRASDLLLVDANDPATLDREDAPEPTAWGLHGSIHRHCPQATCVLHAHPTYATVLASLADSRMLPVDQNTARFFDRMVIDQAFAGMAFEDEGERCARLLGNKKVMLMGNHGVMIVASSVAEAFDDLYYFERAARTLVLAYQTGKELRLLADDVAEKVATQWEQYTFTQQAHFRELKVILDAEEPDYRD